MPPTVTLLTVPKSEIETLEQQVARLEAEKERIEKEIAVLRKGLKAVSHPEITISKRLRKLRSSSREADGDHIR